MWRRKRRMLRLHVVVPERKEIVAVEGIFFGFEAGHYKLVNARHFESAEQSVPLKGETWIPRERVFYAQEVSP